MCGCSTRTLFSPMTYHIGKHVRVIAYQTENPHPGAVQLKHPQGIGLRIHRPCDDRQPAVRAKICAVYLLVFRFLIAAPGCQMTCAVPQHLGDVLAPGEYVSCRWDSHMAVRAALAAESPERKRIEA